MTDFCETITNKLLALMERGVVPWSKHYRNCNDGQLLGLPLRHEGTIYNGINTVILWMASLERGYTAPHWMTYKQAQSYGGQVRKGEKSETVCYFGSVSRAEEQDGEETTSTYKFLKCYSVFNVLQIDGLPAQFAVNDQETVQNVQHGFGFDDLLKHHQIEIITGIKPTYYPCFDKITMPHQSTYETEAYHYADLSHELTHWTGHATRLDRFKPGQRDVAVYGFEELVAELGAAFLCARHGIENTLLDEHASYLAGWISQMKLDPRFIFRAAGAAQKAFNFLESYKGAEDSAVAERAA